MIITGDVKTEGLLNEAPALPLFRCDLREDFVFREHFKKNQKKKPSVCAVVFERDRVTLSIWILMECVHAAHTEASRTAITLRRIFNPIK